MKRALAIAIFVTFGLFPAVAQNSQHVIPAGSDIYRLLRYMAIDGGHALPSQSRPFTAAGVENELRRLREGGLSRPARRAVEAVEAEMNPRVFYAESHGDAAAMAFGAQLNASVELYPRFGYVPDAREPASNEVIRYPFDENWERGTLERLPLLTLPVRMWLAESTYAHMELELTEEPATIIRKPEKLTNVIEEPYDADLHFPDRAFLSVGGVHWSLLFGRETISWGNGRTGNLLISDDVDYHDGLSLRAFHRAFTFATSYVSLEPWRTPEEVAWDMSDQAPYKAFFGHRFEFRFFDAVQLALAESVMYGRRYPDLSHLNPLMVFHNWFIFRFANSMLTAEVDVTPLRRLNLYGQFILYQYQSPVEIETWEGADAQPNAFGYLVGFETVHPVGNAWIVLLGEWVVTNPWLYTIRYGNPRISYSTRRRVTAHTQYYLDRSLGYAYGPDTDARSLRVDYLLPGRWGAGIELTRRRVGEMRFWDPYADGTVEPIPEDAVARTTPTGDAPERTTVLTLDGGLDAPLPFLHELVGSRWGVDAGVSFVWVENAENVADVSRTWTEVWLALSVTM